MDQPSWTARAVGLLLTMAWAGLAAWLLWQGTPSWPAAWPLVGAIVAALSLFAARRPSSAPEGVIVVIGATALVLLASLAVSLTEPSAVAGRSLVGASASMAYGGGVAVAATALFTLLAAAGTRLRMPAAASLSVIAGILAGAGLLLSPVGEATAAGCAPPAAASTGRVDLWARALVDDEEVARATLGGERNGADEAWRGELTGDALEARSGGYTLLGERAWTTAPTGEWQAVPSGRENAPTGALDVRVADVISQLTGPEVEDRGVDALDGQPLRHCRRLVSGSQAANAFEPLNWLVGEQPFVRSGAIGVWRGELDWWIDAAGELVAAHVSVGGLASDALAARGLRGVLVADMRISERGAPRTIDEPLP